MSCYSCNGAFHPQQMTVDRAGFPSCKKCVWNRELKYFVQVGLDGRFFKPEDSLSSYQYKKILMFIRKQDRETIQTRDAGLALAARQFDKEERRLKANQAFELKTNNTLRRGMSEDYFEESLTYINNFYRIWFLIIARDRRNEEETVRNAYDEQCFRDIESLQKFADQLADETRDKLEQFDEESRFLEEDIEEPSCRRGRYAEIKRRDYDEKNVRSRNMSKKTSKDELRRRSLSRSDSGNRKKG